jgi:hypothetical protein
LIFADYPAARISPTVCPSLQNICGGYRFSLILETR